MSAAVIEEVQVIDEEKAGRGKLVILLAVLLVLLLGAGGAWWFFVREPPEPPEPTDGEIVTFEPLTTTVGEAQLRHARVAIAVVLSDGTDPTIVEPKIALLQDALLREVAQMNADELRSADGSAHLRKALTKHAIGIWGEEAVRRVVLTELLVQ
jgi:flagellar FliL protein